MSDPVTEVEAAMVLNALEALGPIVRHHVIRELGAGLPGALAGDRALLSRLPGPVADILLDWRSQFDLEKEKDKMARSHTRFVRNGDAGFPSLLGSLEHPPVGLYARGPFAFTLPAIAVVGSQRATLYGQSIAKRLGRQLAQRGFCVVGGFSRGIDTAAHQGALEAGGATAAVLASGVDVVEPAENIDLYRMLLEKGAVASERPLGMAADEASQESRSWLIAGMCEAVVIVESERGSSAMIVARAAGELGRPLFAVPGRIDQDTSSGCHQLIRDGATLLTSVEDVLSELQYLGGLRPIPIAAPAPRPSLN